MKSITLFTAIVDYNKSLEEVIKEGGYDLQLKLEVVIKGYPIIIGEGLVEYEFVYISSGSSISSSEAVAMIKKENVENPWEPANIEHLLTFGKNFPEEQLRHRIVALGSISRGNFKLVPILASYCGSRRSFNDYWYFPVTGWSTEHRFLAVRKVK